jgi:hypothetical protein
MVTQKHTMAQKRRYVLSERRGMPHFELTPLRQRAHA